MEWGREVQDSLGSVSSSCRTLSAPIFDNAFPIGAKGVGALAMVAWTGSVARGGLREGS